MNTTAVAKRDFREYLGGFINVNLTTQQAGAFGAFNAVNPKDIISQAFTQAAAGDAQAAEWVHRLQVEALSQQTVDAFKAQAAAAAVDIKALQAKFLKDKGAQSRHTRQAYAAGLLEFGRFCEDEGIDAAALTPSQADDFIRYLKDTGASSATVNLRKSAVRAFYSFLNRETDEIVRNPFAGSQVKVKAKRVRKCLYPTREEVGRIIAYFKQHEATGRLTQIAAIMANDGFRVGAFETMTIENGKASFTSKGKTYIARRLSQASLDALNGARGVLFADKTTLQWQHLWQKHVRTMYEAGLLRDEFSPHDFRHYYATELYKATKDIRKVQVALGHSNIAITDTYLRGLGVLDD